MIHGRWRRTAADPPRPGDLVSFYRDPSQPGVANSHVGLDAAGGPILDAPAPGAIVRLVPLWHGRVGAGRVHGAPPARP